MKVFGYTLDKVNKRPNTQSYNFEVVTLGV